MRQRRYLIIHVVPLMCCKCTNTNTLLFMFTLLRLTCICIGQRHLKGRGNTMRVNQTKSDLWVVRLTMELTRQVTEMKVKTTAWRAGHQQEKFDWMAKIEEMQRVKEELQKEGVEERQQLQQRACQEKLQWQQKAYEHFKEASEWKNLMAQYKFSLPRASSPASCISPVGNASHPETPLQCHL